MRRYFPIALAIEGRQCVVVGGGAVAVRRVDALLRAGGDVTVVAPKANAEIRVRAKTGQIRLERAEYRASHLEGAFLVIIATDRPEVNAQVAADAQARGVLCNDAETSERGDFVVPSVLRRGDLLLTVTTGGQSPSLTVRIRDELAERYGMEYAEHVALLGEIRDMARREIADERRRRRALLALDRDEKTILALIREGRPQEARAKAISCISSSLD